MKPPITNSWTVLVIAVVFGAVAVFAASRYMTQTLQAEKAKLNPNVATVDIVVAKRSLERGDLVSAENMAVRPVPKDYVPGSAVDPNTFANVEGARLAVGMRSGEILLRGTLEGADASTFSTKIEAGVRAITLTVDEVNSISGLLQPNDRVDLFYTAKPIRGGAFNASAPEQTRLLLQKVVILATGRQVRPSITGNTQTGAGRAFTTITIEASPLDAQRLILAQKSGHITAVLRGVNDEDAITAKVMDVGSLFQTASTRRGPTGVPLSTEVIVGGRGKLKSEMLRIALLDNADRFGRTAPAPSLEVEKTSGAQDVAQALKDLIAAPPSADAMTLAR